MSQPASQAALTATYILVPGYCHPAVFFQPLIAELKQKGVDAIAYQYPTLGTEAKCSTLQDDIDALSETIVHVLDKERNAILMCHSFGGWVGSRAIHKLDIETRQQQGKQTGVIEIIFLAAFLILDNARASDVREKPPWLDYAPDLRTPNEKAKHFFFNDMDEDAQEYWFKQLQPSRMVTLGDTQPNAPWHLTLPKTFIILTKDECMPLKMQLKMLSGVIDETWTIKSLCSGHDPFLSRPTDLVTVLLGQ